jgi:hypothetical protein
MFASAAVVKYNLRAVRNQQKVWKTACVTSHYLALRYRTHTLQNNEEPASQQRLTPLSVSTPHQHKGRKTCAPTRVFNLLAADNAYCHYIERTYNARVAAAAAH